MKHRLRARQPRAREKKSPRRSVRRFSLSVSAFDPPPPSLLDFRGERGGGESSEEPAAFCRQARKAATAHQSFRPETSGIARRLKTQQQCHLLGRLSLHSSVRTPPRSTDDEFVYVVLRRRDNEDGVVAAVRVPAGGVRRGLGHHNGARQDRREWGPRR